MKDKRFYNFTCIIYEDDELFIKQYNNLTSTQQSIWIRHDYDLDDDGTLKKTHYHFVVKLKNAKTISAFSKEMSINENLIEPVKKSLNGSLRYLVHYGYDDKFQYDINLVKSNSDKFLKKFLNLLSDDISEVEKVINIQDYIDNFPDTIKWSVLAKYVQKINQWDAFRRNMLFFTKLIEEHNADIFSKKINSELSHHYVSYNVNNMERYM